MSELEGDARDPDDALHTSVTRFESCMHAYGVTSEVDGSSEGFEADAESALGRMPSQISMPLARRDGR